MFNFYIKFKPRIITNSKFKKVIAKILKLEKRRPASINHSKVEHLINKLMLMPNGSLSNFHLTNKKHKDGGCAQLFRQISTIAFSRYLGLTYRHTPIKTVAHNVNNDPNWSQKWNDFLNLDRFGQQTKLNEKYIPIKNILDLLSFIEKNKHNNRKYYIQVPDCHAFTNRNPSLFLNIQNELQNHFLENQSSIPSILNKNKLNISIHARRGDVTPSQNYNRYTPADKIALAIKKIIQVLGCQNLNINLFSMSLDEDLKSLEKFGVNIRTHHDIFDVLSHLIYSDIHITSKSTVSYVAGLLSNNTVIYEPFWHPKLPGWLNNEQEFTKENLLTKLEFKI